MADELEPMTEADVSQYLLDYAAGRLDETGRARAEALAAASPGRAEELAYYTGMVQARGDQKDTGSAGELGWARLSRAMDTEATALEAMIPVADNDNMQPWKYATLALGLIALVQGAFLFAPGAETGADQDAPIYTPVISASDGFIAQVTFVPSASEAGIRSLLLSVDGEIVTGPSALGVYEIAFESDEARTDGLERLDQAADIIESSSIR